MKDWKFKVFTKELASLDIKNLGTEIRILLAVVVRKMTLDLALLIVFLDRRLNIFRILAMV